MRIQLRKCSEGKLISRRTVQVRAMEERKRLEGPDLRAPGLARDLMVDVGGLGSAGDSDQEVVLGIARRVGLLILISIAGFIVLFFFGLQFLNVE